MTYHLFAGANYYPEYGLNDYVGPFENPDTAVSEGKSRVENFYDDWWVVIYQDYDSNRLVEHDRGYRGSDL